MLQSVLATLAVLGVAAAAQPLSLAGERKGTAHFVRPPWRADLVSFTTTAGRPNPKYFFTVELDQGAGASLGGLEIRQTRGVDSSFPISAERTQAFLGRPRRQGQSVPVQASFSSHERLVQIRFPQPVPPGSTVTVVLRPWRNPATADTYMFQVSALPAGPNPVVAPLGFATLRIYSPDWR